MVTQINIQAVGIYLKRSSHFLQDSQYLILFYQ